MERKTRHMMLRMAHRRSKVEEVVGFVGYCAALVVFGIVVWFLFGLL